MKLEGNRKLLAFLFTVVATCLLGYTTELGGDNVQAIFTALIWAFIAGNAAEHISKKMGNQP